MRQDFSNLLPNFVAEPNFLRRYPDGRQILWEAIDETETDYIDEATGKRRVKAGTPMSILAGGKMIPYGLTDAVSSPEETPTTAEGLLASEANEDSRAEALSGYGLITATAVWENLLPGGAPSGGTKTALVNGGCLFTYHTYEDDRAD